MAGGQIVGYGMTGLIVCVVCMCTSFRVLNRLKYQEILCDNLVIQDVKIFNTKVNLDHS